MERKESSMEVQEQNLNGGQVEEQKDVKMEDKTDVEMEEKEKEEKKEEEKEEKEEKKEEEKEEKKELKQGEEETPEGNIIEVGGKRRRSNPREKKEKEEGDEEGEGEGKGKKYKVGLLGMYAGFEYQGLQMNPGAHTIEEVLHKALISAGCVGYDNQCLFICFLLLFVCLFICLFVCLFIYLLVLGCNCCWWWLFSNFPTSATPKNCLAKVCKNRQRLLALPFSLFLSPFPSFSSFLFFPPSPPLLPPSPHLLLTKIQESPLLEMLSLAKFSFKTNHPSPKQEKKSTLFFPIM